MELNHVKYSDFKAEVQSTEDVKSLIYIYRDIIRKMNDIGSTLFDGSEDMSDEEISRYESEWSHLKGNRQIVAMEIADRISEVI